MKIINFTVTHELFTAIEAARTSPNGEWMLPRNSQIESWLWSVSAIREAAKREGVEIHPKRKTAGRPAAD